MKKKTLPVSFQKLFRTAWIPALMLLGTSPVFAAAGDSPWESAVNALQTSFTGPIARGLSLVAIVVGGLAFAFGEGDSKRMLAGIIFGLGMALGAVQLMGWLFG
jgi:type IV secretory pathway VirB2 component (pilin)